MQLLNLVHVLSAIIGVGPAFFALVLLRKNQSLSELRHSLRLTKRLEYFPKIGGSLAVLTGIILVMIGSYGSFMQLWLIGSLLIYIFIQILVIGFALPASKMLSQWVFDKANDQAEALPADQTRLFHKINSLHWIASCAGVLLFILMIIKA